MATSPRELISTRAASIESSVTLEITALAASLKAQGKNVIAFAAGEPDLGVPDDINEAAIAAIRAGKGRYTAAAGLPELREAIAARFRRDGFRYQADEVMCTSGAKPAIYEALFVLLNDGDEVIFPSPFWGSYTEIVRAAHGVPIPLKTLPSEDFQPDPAALRRLITPKTRVLLINSPNNPTGTVYTEATLRALAEVVREKDLVVISDDIYDCLVYTGSPYVHLLHVAPDLVDRTIVINSLSKSHSMTGWRVGLVAAPKPVIQTMARVQSQMIGNPPTITQHAALKALAGPPDPARAASLDARRRVLIRLLQEIPELEVPVPRGAFYAFPSVAKYLNRKRRGKPIGTSTEFCRALLEDQLVATVPGDAFGAPEHVRLTYTVPEADIVEGVRRLRAFLLSLER